MIRQSRFRPAARRDLKRLAKFFDDAPPEIPEILAQLLEERVEKLRRFPFMGRPLERNDLRETIVVYGKSRYVIRYQMTDDAVRITRIWHGRQNRG